MELLIIWLLFGIVCAIIASKRGRNWFGWLLIGSIIGVFGLILVLVLPSRAPDKALASGQTKVCPYCAEHIQAAATVCRYCGRDL